MANNTLEVSLALKTAGYRSDVNAVKKDNQLLKAEFDKLASSVDKFEETLEGKQARLKLVSKEYENAQKLVDIYKKQVEEAGKAVESANKKFNDQQKELNAAKAYVEKYKDATGDTAKVVAETEARIEELEKEFNKQAKVVASANTQYQNMQIALARAEIDLNNLEDELRETATEFYNTQRSIDNANNSLVNFSVTADDVQVSVNGSSVSLTKLSDNLKSTGSAITSAGKIASVASGIVTGLGATAVATAVSFEQSMANVSATMGITAEEIADGSESFTKLKEAALESAKTTEFSASQSAEALNYLALAGYDVEKAIETLPKVLTLASAGGLDLAYASDLLTDSMSALQIETDQVDTVIDQLAKASQSSNTSVAQLGEALLTVGGTANTLSNGVTEANTALGVLADNGIKGSEGGTALRNVILSLTAPTDTATKSLKKYGIKVKDANNEMRPLVDIFSDFNEQMSDLSRAEKAEALNKIFNKTDLVAVNALMASTVVNTIDLNQSLSDMGISVEENADKINHLTSTFELGEDKAEFMNQAMQEMGISVEQASGFYDVLSDAVGGGVSRFNELNEKIANSEGAANSMAETLRSTTAGSFQELGSKLEVLAIGFGDLLLPTLDKVVNMLGSVVDWFASLSDTTKGTILAIGGIIAVAGPLLVMIGTLISSLGTIIGAFTSVATAISGAGGIMAFFTTTMLPVIATIGLVIGAVVALFLAIKENFDGIKEATTSLIEKCKPYFEELGQAFSGLWVMCQSIYDTVIAPLFHMIGEIIEVAITFATPFFILFANVFSEVINKVVNVWNSVGQPLMSTIMFIIQSLFDFVKPIFILIGEAFTAMIEVFLSVYDNTLSPLIESIISIIGGLLDKVRPTFESIKESIVNALDTVNKAIDGAISWIRDLLNTISGALGKVGEFLSSLNPFKSKSIDVEATMNANLPKMNALDVPINPIGDIALSGSYYNSNTPLSTSMAKLGSVASGLSNNGGSTVIKQDNSQIESILEKYLSQFVQAMASFNPSIEVGLNVRKLSEEINVINGQGLKLNERWR